MALLRHPQAMRHLARAPDHTKDNLVAIVERTAAPSANHDRSGFYDFSQCGIVVGANWVWCIFQLLGSGSAPRKQISDYNSAISNFFSKSPTSSNCGVIYI